MDEALTVREDVVIPASEMWFTAARSGGPGGQYVITTSSRVTLHFDVANTTALTPRQKALVLRRLANRITGRDTLRVSADTERSQHANRRIARERLAELLREALTVPKRRLPTRVPERSELRRLSDKAKRSTLKQLRAPPKADS
jgi:ribosome-associated protein